MANLNTTETENYSQFESRILGAIPLMSPENQRTLARFAETMVNNGLSSAYATLTPKQRLDALSDAATRMKSHSIVLGQFFTRPATKQAALEGMEAELANLQTLWALVRADLPEVQP
ncbi:hypothetical protein J9253_15460 [Thiothrix litoralis]|uniref:Phasin protein n=1 Tax=Thiothrix litoralis TaxID=2891210 RepID=A0ABX7WWS7_9GAMM|nr:hypothetical protein [Thiothrix litoralis]QTR45390.1 hypothetical protein J9253_15460 [Thiothrix litoralis]